MTTPACKTRRDGWTRARRLRLLGMLAGGWDVRSACARIGPSRQAAYRWRRRDPAFASAWDEALRQSRAAAERDFLALLPARLREDPATPPRQNEVRAQQSERGGGEYFA